MKRKLQQIDFDGWTLLTDEARAYICALEENASERDEAIRQATLEVLDIERAELIASLAEREGRLN